MDTTELEFKLEETIDESLETVLDYARRKNVDEERQKHAEDPLFSRFNFDTKEFVIAKAGNGLTTSIHRKVGDLVEENIQTIFKHRLDIKGDITYDATIVVDGEQKIRELDAILWLDELSGESYDRVNEIIQTDGQQTGTDHSLNEYGEDGVSWDAIGFEIRHCYQSADSKRAQADISMANHLRNNNVMPVMLILCGDANQDVVGRYKNYMWVYEGEDSFEFVERLSGFDYAEFLDEKEPFIDNKMDRIFQMF